MTIDHKDSKKHKNFGYLLICVTGAVHALPCQLCQAQPLPSTTRTFEQTRQDEQSRREEIEKRQREYKAKQEEFEKQQKQRREEYLSTLQQRFTEATAKKDSEPANYINAELDYANALLNNGDDKRANQLFEHAYYVFTTYKSDDVLKAVRADSLWTYIIKQKLSDAQFEAKFQQLFRPSALQSENDLYRMVSNAIESRSSRMGQSSGERKRLCLLEYNLTANLFGATSERLIPFVNMYASICESEHDLDEAERQIKKADLLYRDQSDSAKAYRQVQLAEFYLRHNKIEKADAAIANAQRISSARVNSNLARSYAHYLDQYRRVAKNTEYEKLVNEMLAISGDELIKSIDPQIESLANDYISSGSLARAEMLVRKRINASSLCRSDYAATDWRLKLSEILLAMNRDAESKKIFDEVKTSTALQGGSPNALIERRAALLDRLGKKGGSAALRKQMPKPVATGPITIRYGLLAYYMRFGFNTNFHCIDSRGQKVQMVREGGDICCLASFVNEGNFLFNGTVHAPQQVVNQYEQRNASQRPAPPPPPPPPSYPGSGVSPPIPYPRRPISPRRMRSPFNPNFEPLQYSISLAPALAAPANATKLDFADRTHLGKSLEPGNYIVNSLNVPRLSGTGPVRLFLSEGTGSGDRISSGKISVGSQSGIFQDKAINLQIFYNGIKPLHIGSGFSGIIYAPNATVELGFNARVVGAIVARQIVGEGNNSFTLDQGLIGQTLNASR